MTCSFIKSVHLHFNQTPTESPVSKHHPAEVFSFTSRQHHVIQCQFRRHHGLVDILPDSPTPLSSCGIMMHMTRTLVLLLSGITEQVVWTGQEVVNATQTHTHISHMSSVNCRLECVCFNQCRHLHLSDILRESDSWVCERDK